MFTLSEEETPVKARSRRRLGILVAVLAVVLLAAAGFAAYFLTRDKGIGDYVVREESSVRIASPGGNTVLVLTTADGQLRYQVERDGRPFTEAGALGVTVDSVAYGAADSVEQLGKITGEVRTDKRTINGRMKEAAEPCVSAVVPVNTQGKEFTLEVRVFDNGAAFRYRLPGEGNRVVKSEQTSFALPAGSMLWASDTHVYYESKVEKRDPSKESDQTLATPATVQLPDGGYAAILEGNLGNYAGMSLAWRGENQYGADFTHGKAATFVLSGEIVTPWRIVAVADDLDQLVNNTIVYQVCDAPEESLFDGGWIKPGRAVWSWITSRTSDRVTPEIMEAYTEDAAVLGFEYNLIDEGWVHWEDYESVLRSLADQGAPYGVGQILWTGVTAGAGYGNGIKDFADARRYLDFLSDTGMKGGKIDFFTTETSVEMGVDIYREILQYAAEKQLLINFHGCNKPTGLDATWPNELNREAILGLESTQVTNRNAQAQMFTTQVFTRNLAGHADYTPAVDTAFHMAQLVLTDAPLQAIGTSTETLLSLPSLEMIKSVPTVWDRTVVLPQSAIGEAAVYARESAGGSWFVGGINYRSPDSATVLELSCFLGEGSYRMELWTDGKDGLEKQTRTVTREDTVEVPFDKLSGFIARFDRVALSQYGGEILFGTPVTVEVPDPATVAAYTLDGSEPDASSPRVENGTAIELTDSAVLTVKILDGPGKGRVQSYRFNRIATPRVRVVSEQDEGGTATVTLKPNFDAPLHYTTDGSLPDAGSPVYEGPFLMEHSGLLQLYAETGDTPFRMSQYIESAPAIEVNPELALTDAEWLSATTGYAGDPATKDRNTKGRTIAIAGTRYSRGLGTNAIGTFEYAVPENADRFVAVCGIDDGIRSDGNYTLASATVSVSFSGGGLEGNSLPYTTPVFVYGEKLVIDLPVPEGAEKILITCGDAGDGIVCDNVSIGNPGWMLK